MVEYYISPSTHGRKRVAKFDGSDVPAAVYFVDLRGRKPTCTCPDFVHRKRICKHIRMVKENSRD